MHLLLHESLLSRHFQQAFSYDELIKADTMMISIIVATW